MSGLADSFQCHYPSYYSKSVEPRRPLDLLASSIGLFSASSLASARRGGPLSRKTERNERIHHPVHRQVGGMAGMKCALVSAIIPSVGGPGRHASNEGDRL